MRGEVPGGIMPPLNYADYLVTQVLSRCNEKSDRDSLAGGSNPFKALMSNLVDDLLVVQTLPQLVSGYYHGTYYFH